jgi:hypothetical protein
MPPTGSPWIAMALTLSSIVHTPQVVTPTVKPIAGLGAEDERRNLGGRPRPGNDAVAPTGAVQAAGAQEDAVARSVRVPVPVSR